MTQHLAHADGLRRDIAAQSARAHKSRLGQFMTPSATARFMASLFVADDRENCRLLDAGAGIGSLSCAFLDRWRSGELRFRDVEVDAYEIDTNLRVRLADVLGLYAHPDGFRANVMAGDFIEEAVNQLQFGELGRYTHAILNPPYKKIGGDSRHRLLLREVGIETVNLYSAFVALALARMAPGGRLVAIIPRSFCNGPYYRPFREFIRDRAAIRHLHLFGSRTQAFRDDEVLQENLIVVLDRDGEQGDVTVSTSTDDEFQDYAEHRHAFGRIVFPGDSEAFIHVPTSTATSLIERYRTVHCSLADLDLQVSTGPVVDFRLREHLHDLPARGRVPLLYPLHFSDAGMQWPRPGAKKPNAIERNVETEKWLFPRGTYVVVRRFSSKEEKRRIVANVVAPHRLADAPMIGFENHLNVFHCRRQGIPESLAYGLAAYLNSTAVDEWFRRFNGHTQVNATDLKLMRYPERSTLFELGEWAMRQEAGTTQERIDERLDAWIA